MDEAREAAASGRLDGLPTSADRDQPEAGGGAEGDGGNDPVIDHFPPELMLNGAREEGGAGRTGEHPALGNRQGRQTDQERRDQD